MFKGNKKKKRLKNKNAMLSIDRKYGYVNCEVEILYNTRRIIIIFFVVNEE